VQRSGCGIMAKWRPSGLQMAAIPCGEPLPKIKKSKIIDFFALYQKRFVSLWREIRANFVRGNHRVQIPNRSRG